ncbi:coiled-coil domain-containing protein [Streptomyces similanensis]|uniref:Uncharacterized protein n=1 Tax=Streptomyces similanensis TaxID=1274988 RepID=A0ABP9KDB1_9ACTN
MSSTRRAPKRKRDKRRAETEALRTARRDTLGILLSRVRRSVALSPAEAALLAAHVEAELTEADRARESERGQQRAMEQHRQRVTAAEETIRELEQQATVADERAECWKRQAANWEQANEQAEQRLARIRDMTDNWVRHLPATIRTATAAEAVRNAANGDDRPVMFAITGQQATAGTKEFAEQERARFERLYTRETLRADKAEAERDRLTAELEDAEHRADTYRAAWHSARARARKATQRAERAEEFSKFAEAAATRSEQGAEDYRGALSHALGLGNGAPWDAIHERTRALRKADERAEAEANRERKYAIKAAQRLDAAEQRAKAAEQQLGQSVGRAAQAITAMGADVRAAEQRAGRYRLAWLACRRDRKADRAAMAAELPIVQAAHRALATAEELFVTSPDGAMRETGRRVLTAFLQQEPAQPKDEAEAAEVPLIAVGPARGAQLTGAEAAENLRRWATSGISFAQLNTRRR